MSHNSKMQLKIRSAFKTHVFTTADGKCLEPRKNQNESVNQTGKVDDHEHV